MKIAVLGAGAVGGYFGGRLAAAGEDVAFVARGTHLEALRRGGLSIRSPKGDLHLDGSRPIAFTLDRSNDFPPPPDLLQVTFAPGTLLELNIPFDPFTPGPDFFQPAEGVLTLKGKELPFRLISTDPFAFPSRWDRLEAPLRRRRDRLHTQ